MRTLDGTPKQYLHLSDELRPPWSPLKDVTPAFPPQGADVRVFQNSRYTVIDTPLKPASIEDTGLQTVHWLSIHDHERSTRHDWRDFQKIKNEICGAESEGVEIYPSEDYLVDTSNQYHVYVFPRATLNAAGIGFGERLVSEMKPEGNGDQRQWEQGQRPADAIEASKMRVMVAQAKARGAR